LRISAVAAAAAAAAHFQDVSESLMDCRDNNRAILRSYLR